MQKESWNQRYAANDSVYGTQPNQFFKTFIDSHQPGTILLPADGEGRNAIYAAKQGWTADAFDFSETARNKAAERAEAEGLLIHYELKDLTAYKAIRQYDAIALIYVHLPEDIRKPFHQELVKSLNPDGYIIVEAFTPRQLSYNSGGPKDAALLYTADIICDDFAALEILLCEELIAEIQEGDFHKGEASILRFIGRKKS